MTAGGRDHLSDFSDFIPADLVSCRPEQAAPGLPPELAKLGISATDWEQIQSALNSDVGAGDADAIPAEYRALVKSYFESMSKSSSR